MAKQTVQQLEQAEEATKVLREMFPPGSTAKTILRHVAGSGMSRWISVVSPECEDVTYLVARVLGEKVDQRHGGIRVAGAGMDMGFSLVYGMSRRLYPEGFECVGERCPANDHSNGDHDHSPHLHASAGGYAVSQRWL